MPIYLFFDESGNLDFSRNGTKYYLFGVLTRLPRHEGSNEKVILITDSLPVKRKRQAVEKAFKVFMRRTLGERRFAVQHHSSTAHPGLQAADYCTWALYRKWHRGDLRSYELVEPYVRSEIEAFGEVAAGG